MPFLYGQSQRLPDLKAQWRELFGTEPHGYNRRFLESRLAYRIQELAYGGLKPEIVKRLEVLGEQFADRNITRRRIRHDAMPIAGTRLVREWQGVEHTVTVLAEGYEWAGPTVSLILRGGVDRNPCTREAAVLREKV